jgi:hypothetical protein
MSKDSDVEALVHFLAYSEQEARRLNLSAVVVHSLRIALDELIKTTSVRPETQTVPDNSVH